MRTERSRSASALIFTAAILAAPFASFAQSPRSTDPARQSQGGQSQREVRTEDGRSPANSALRLDDLLWREVQNLQGEQLGALSDVLVQMPSGRIVFATVDPAAFFERPKAVPPPALRLPETRAQPLQVDISMKRWLAAPVLDWDAARVIKNTREGGRIYGYYQQTWREPDPTPPWGMNVTASMDDGTGGDARYVSLKQLLLERVVTNGGQQVGYVNGFVIDWTDMRATHALISPRFRSTGGSPERSFAVPVALLNPPIEEDAITVNSSTEAFRDAPSWPGEAKGPIREATTVYRYPPSESAGAPDGRRDNRRKAQPRR